MTAAFDADGFAVLPQLLSGPELVDIEAAMTRHDGVGSRELLAEPWCAELARRLHADARLAGAIPRPVRAAALAVRPRVGARARALARHPSPCAPIRARRRRSSDCRDRKSVV